ncbi:MAG: hypothetical protein LH614_04545 [Pyrinomonadaceae bacterium]|nr:hypothetical protein [Pyrinomonadaceae bacterium]
MQNNVYLPAPLVPVKIKLGEGIYLVKRQSVVLPNAIDHYAVIVVGKLLLHLGFSEELPLVFHLTDEGIRVDWLETSGSWQVLGGVHPTQRINAITRLKSAYNNPNYNLFSNNCEQFARFVTEGYKQSVQLQNAALFSVGVIGMILWANSEQ